MKADLLASELINNPSKEPDTLYKQYHTILSTLIDKHASLHTKHTKAKYIPGWVNDTVKETKRSLERIWRRNKSTFNRSQYMQKVHQYNRIFKNYRPVSNLNFISKILERVVAVQLQTHLDEAGLMTAFQSAYRKHHSTESALLNIHNDILLNMAKGSVTALTLLDLSATFDTIDHTILLDRLNVYYGISELALGWFKSCLSAKTHSV